MAQIPSGPSTVTFTGPIGPGKSVTSLQFTHVRQLNYNFAAATVEVLDSSPNSTFFDISAISTITATISSDVATFTMS